MVRLVYWWSYSNCVSVLHASRLARFKLHRCPDEVQHSYTRVHEQATRLKAGAAAGLGGASGLARIHGSTTDGRRAH